MSNEFVMVPRAELVRLQESMDPHRGAVAWGIVCDLLAKPVMRQGEPVAWRYQTHTGGLWYLSSSEHNARMFESTEKGSCVEPLYTHADPGEVERTLECQRREFSHAQTVEHRKWAELVDSLKARQAKLDALLREAVVWCNPGLQAKIKAAISASAEPSAPVEIDERGLCCHDENWEFKIHPKCMLCAGTGIVQKELFPERAGLPCDGIPF